MTRDGRKTRAVLGDLARLVAPMDVLYQVGNLIYRRSLRYTLLTAGIAVIGVLADLLNLPGLTIGQAIMLPLIVGGVAFVGGFTMKLIPRMISTRLLTVAQACGLNLMEDYRKSAAGEHIEALWERVFVHECRLRLDAGLDVMGARDDAPSGGEALASARKRFVTRARRALASHLPQTRQMHQTGLDLRYFEDWRDGAYLDRSDTKLVEQFTGNLTLLAARRQAGLAGPGAMTRFWPARLAGRFWFFVITRCVAIEVGQAIERLNRRYDTDMFGAQSLLWPGEEDQAWLAEFDGGREAVLDHRRRIVKRIFGPDLQTAHAVLDHMLRCPIILAGELRIRYDAEYCCGRLHGCDAVADLKAAGAVSRDVRSAERFAESAARDMDVFDRLITLHRGGLLQPDRALACRAVRIALHTGRKKLRRALGGDIRPDMSAEQFERHLAPLVDAAADDARTYTHRLVAVRMHHELARLAREDYRKLIAALAYDDPQPGPRS